MADLPFDLAPVAFARFLRHFDPEAKLPRALQALGPVARRDVVVVDAGRGVVAGQLAVLGARVTALERPGALADLERAVRASPLLAGVRVAEGTPERLGLPDESVDVVVGCWSAYRGPEPAELAEAERVLRPGGRLLVVHDYGRDEASQLRDPGLPEYTSWGRRDGPFLRAGFRIRVIHCWWRFDDLETARSVLAEVFGPPGAALGERLRRPRVAHNIAVYHRSKDEEMDEEPGEEGAVEGVEAARP
ncbi:MAG TPA: methyltransferase domain-containing protein [Candidatus Binatia bacterium]|nr:methyltransferase domain-containing protein [Candidatus Binatia bacterium]